ncbi:hypothetical protein GC169_06950 [bacterium]|nr:hypothetical protein [bacterium]
MIFRALITRTEPGASATADRVRQRGLHPIIEPFSRIEPIKFEPPTPPYTAIFTSQNGVRSVFEAGLTHVSAVYCVGDATAAEAHNLGFKNIHSARGDVEALFELIQSNVAVSGCPLVHFSNEQPRGDLVGRLKNAGFEARFVPVYRAVERPAPGPELSRLLAGEARTDVVLIHAPRAGSLLAKWAAARTGAGSRVASLNVAAISHAAAEAVRSVADRVVVADHPDEAALIEAAAALVGLP